MLPLLDLAYQGLGHGMEADAQGTRKVLAVVPEAIIAYSCDKNFGLYRDRVGAVYAMTASAEQTTAVLSNGQRTTIPPYMTVGTKVVILTEDGSYVERAKE